MMIPCRNPACELPANTDPTISVGFCCEKCEGRFNGEEWAMNTKGKKHTKFCSGNGKIGLDWTGAQKAQQQNIMNAMMMGMMLGNDCNSLLPSVNPGMEVLSNLAGLVPGAAGIPGAIPGVMGPLVPTGGAAASTALPSLPSLTVEPPWVCTMCGTQNVAGSVACMICKAPNLQATVATPALSVLQPPEPLPVIQVGGGQPPPQTTHAPVMDKSKSLHEQTLSNSMMLGVEGRENNSAMISELSTQSLEQQKLMSAALQHPDVMHQMMKNPQTYLTAMSGGNEEVIQAMTGSQSKADAMLAAARNPDRHKNAKPGDWNCPNCGDLVFASNAHCRCGTSKALAIQMGTTTAGRPGDWTCQSCFVTNFSTTKACRGCGAVRPEGTERVNMKAGDWICSGCGDLVFASRAVCKMCGQQKPDEYWRLTGAPNKNQYPSQRPQPHAMPY